MHRILVPEVCPEPENSLGKSLASWLECLPWDYYWTITCRKPRRDSLAFIRDITNELHRQGAIRAFIGCEPHRFNYNLHAHGLLLGQTIAGTRLSSGYLPGTTTEVWHELFCRFGRSRVEHIYSTESVARYCSKYVTKMSDGDNWAIWMLDKDNEIAYPETQRVWGEVDYG